MGSVKVKRLFLLLPLIAACTLSAVGMAGAVTPEVRPYRFAFADGAWSRADNPRISGTQVIYESLEPVPMDADLDPRPRSGCLTPLLGPANGWSVEITGSRSWEGPTSAGTS